VPPEVKDNRDASDEALLRSFSQGNAAAFRTLVTRHKTPLFNFALRHLRSQTAAEDIVQDAFVRMVQSAGDFKHESKFTTWAYAIVRNLCIDQLRKNALRKHPSLDQKTREEGPSLGEQLPDPRTDVERAVVSTELRAVLLTAVDALPLEQREVFMMREISNLPFQEIAEITGVSENTVKSRMRYALERLQESLAEFHTHARTLP
jgi:RNA polymerase sigma-70 factor, ECF subfamily